MRSVSLFATVVLCLPAAATGQTRESIVPAGTLLQCTLDEPRFSSRTAQVGDPVLCNIRSLVIFGQAMLPRGAYLSGRFEDYRDPGRFVGKGWLTLKQLSLPDTVLPVSAKLVAVHGYRVDREGKIIGRGHANRDTIEWLTPPLWPWKVVSLAARGPRPTLKGETQVTLRLMDDVALPIAATSRPPALLPAASRPVEWKLWPPAPSFPSSMDRPSPGKYSPMDALSPQTEGGGAFPKESASTLVADSHSAAERQPTRLTLIAVKGEMIYGVADYWVEDARLFYAFPSGIEGALHFGAVDWKKTLELNAERGIAVTLQSRSH
jgi:hypothetical protein